MKIDILTLFPEMCETVLSESILGRARKSGKIEVCCHQIRDYTNDKHNRVDDSPYGGGMGMVMQAQPIYDCYKAVTANLPEKPFTVYMSPQGEVLTQQKAEQLAKLPQIVIICGHYEGVDERVIEEIADEELSVGDYVLTGGELPALILTDTVARLCEGVLSASECYEEESHVGGLLEYPQYTRPEEWNGKRVPAVLLSGHHENIAKWRQLMRLLRTKKKRPDMYGRYQRTKQDEKLLKKHAEEQKTSD